MLRMPFQIRMLVPIVVGLALLIAGFGCAGSASTSTRAMGIDAVREVFPSATDMAEVSMVGEVESPGRSGKFFVREIKGSSHLLGYLVETQVRGRSGPFSIAVLLDERHIVIRATVVSYPWSRGREVGRRSFTSQFKGKGPEDAVEVGKDIDAVTGATISCEAMARGVREAVGLLAE